MLARAIAAFLALPGVVAFAIPIGVAVSGRLRVHRSLLALFGALVLLVGGLTLLWSVREFYAAGRGTLAPWAPPQLLVTSGPYRHSRNPMYIGVFLILLGWSALFASWVLLSYAALVLCACHARVTWAEEPLAARRFGANWDAYRSRVPRWLL